jgi:lysophospholipase L1-like esterase
MSLWLTKKAYLFFFRSNFLHPDHFMRIILHGLFLSLVHMAAAFTPFQSGDRLLLVGNTVLERERHYSCFEPSLQLALGEQKLTVRNLGWSGDTVFGDARSYFGPPAEGLKRMGEHLQVLRPTVALLCYGSELAFEESMALTLPEFLSGYTALMKMMREKSGTQLRFIIAAPPPVETLPAPMPDLAEVNLRLAQLRDALRTLAEKEGAVFIDWFQALGEGKATVQLTENGVHYEKQGYKRMAETLLTQLGLKAETLPSAELLSAVRHKDELCFHRWRHQNETYLFGFRKHEQGQNAKEIPALDPLIDECDAKIHTLKKQQLSQSTLR